MSESVPRQGELWWAETEDDRRPVLVVSRSEVIPVVHWVVVAPVTRTMRRLPTELVIGRPEGLSSERVASFDNLQRVRRSALTSQVGSLDAGRRHELCATLAALADC